ncbi:Rid family hydrolase [Mesorhizobium sp. STM 4661]|uniref:Rid family hydrolase n=1 Tax=Mesorhizobium sp. STM 4661 TaxID=1297570 RepID=UPI0002BE65AF|nr:Rid family hydrolase [Mesorhizobium sp. STM 4661]CCV15623.1 Endoribonuclease L-PSP [Mesorhizobium sp. STM 4661]
MVKRAIIPARMKSLYENWRMSPGLECDGFVFLTGINGMSLDGELSAVPSEQIHEAFSQVNMVLAEAGMRFEDVVEMTSYHVGLRDHLEQFKSIRAQYVREPYPAWTAIEVGGFASEGVVVELRVVARKPQ